MVETKRGIIKLAERQEYTAGYHDYVITEDHTIADIARFIKKHGWGEDLICCLNNA